MEKSHGCPKMAGGRRCPPKGEGNPPPGPKGRENGVSDCREGRCRSHNCRRIMSEILPIFDFRVTIGLSKRKLKPEIEEEVAKYKFHIIIGVFSPPLYSPQEPHAVRRATPLGAATPS